MRGIRWSLSTAALIATGMVIGGCGESSSEPTEPAQPVAAKWSYAGATGPEHWGDLSPEYSECSDGKRQSPIDIQDAVSASGPRIAIKYLPEQLTVADNGHAIETIPVNARSTITIADTKFRLVQFHFHHPSEEKIDGRRFDLSIHLVHTTEDGKLAVIGLLANVGQPNSLVGEITSDLPETAGEELKLGGRHKLTDLFPSGTGATKTFRFQGSLTTPPCSEAVDWTVFRKPITVSASQLKRLTASYPMNSRPVQPAEGRKITVGATVRSSNLERPD